MLLCERCELAHELRMASYRQVGFDAFFQRAEAQLIEARDRRLREGVVGEVGKRGAAPQAECFPQRGRGSGGLGVHGFFAQPFEAVEVELSGLQPQFVAGGSCHDRVGSEAPPQLRDIDVQTLGRGRRRSAAPDVIDQSIGGDDLVRVDQQDAERGARLSLRQRDRAVIVHDLERPEDPEVKPAFHASTPARICFPPPGGRKTTTRTQRAARAPFTASGPRASAS